MEGQTEEVRCLLVEDDDDDAFIFRRYVKQLIHWDVTLTRVASVDQALRHIEEEPPDIVFLDLNLQRPDGGMRLLREFDSRGIEIPTIVVTGTGDEQKAVDTMKAGAYDYLVKENLSVYLLERAIRSVLERYAAEQERDHLVDELSESLKKIEDTVELVQDSFLRGKVPDDLEGAEVAATMTPTESLGGDFYDFYQHESALFDVSVGDVMGKGLLATLIGARTTNHILRAIRAFSRDNNDWRIPPPADVMNRVRRVWGTELFEADRFVTVCLGRFDLLANTFTFVDCGHTHTIHYLHQSGETRLLKGNNVPLGFDLGADYEEKTAHFHDADVFVIYTDGVTDVRNESGKRFGVERLVDLVQRHAEDRPAQLIDAIGTGVRDFANDSHLADDFTCVAVKIHEPTIRRSRLATFLCEPDRLTSIRQFVSSCCHDLAGDRIVEDDLNHLRLAVHEAVVNVMGHGYGKQRGKRIRVRADMTGEELIFRVLDTGLPFDLSTVPAPDLDGGEERGYGVYIIKNSVDDVEYFQRPNGENCLTLRKKLTPSVTPQ
jgi:serine phosphatase RsbU (regulator of sigma subunit)/anti-sigma regulatory factor (Ser/Thr protein kinase)